MRESYGSDLNFQATVVDVFSFLESEYNFLPDLSYEYGVKYKKSGVKRLRSVSVGITIEPPLQTLDIDFLRFPYEINLECILSVRSPKDVRLSRLDARNHVVLLSGLRIIAAMLKLYAHDILNNDRQAYAAVLEYAEKESHDYTMDCQYGPVRRKAELAWQTKNLQSARELYESMEEGLRPKEVRRLDYLKKRT